MPPCYEDAIKLNNSASKIVGVHTLKHVTTTSSVTSNETAANDLSGKNASTERDNSSQIASQPHDSPDFATQTTASHECRVSSEKNDVETSQNSSQSENPLAKVLRKSIRGIRKLRSGGEDSATTANPSGGQGSTLESGLSTDRVVIGSETTGKDDR